MNKVLLLILLLAACQGPELAPEPVPSTMSVSPTPQSSVISQPIQTIDIGVIRVPVSQSNSPKPSSTPKPSASVTPKPSATPRPGFASSLEEQLELNIQSLRRAIAGNKTPPDSLKVLPIYPFKSEQKNPKLTRHVILLVSNSQSTDSKGRQTLSGGETHIQHYLDFGYVGHSDIKQIPLADVPANVLAQLSLN